MHVIRYLKGSIDRGLFYRRAETQNGGLPIGYSDSDWAGPNTGRKSVGGFIFLFGDSPISWQSKKQTCIATSTNEAEYMAASEAAKEATWIRRVYTDMRVDESILLPPINLNMDNQGAIALTSTEGTKRSKHIDVRFHHVRDLQQQGIVSINNVPSSAMAADGLTKILRTDAFNRFLSLINMAEEVDG